MKVFGIISTYFEFIRLPALDVNEEPEVYALDGDVLTPIENVLAPVVGALVKAGLVRKSIMGDLELAAFSTSKVTSWRELNPWDKIRLGNGVLDLRELKLLDKTSYYFTYRLDVTLTEEEFKEVKDGSYKVEDNPVFRSWRAHFEDVDWEYLVDSLGAWLAPFRFKHIAFLIGPRNSGKSTLLLNLTEPINPIIARTSLRNIVENRFGLQPLIGKQVLVHSERGDVVLKNLDIINNLLGESDYIPVDRKHLPIVNIKSLKAAMFSMNDPPILYEQGGETLAAFLERLSIIFMKPPDGFKPVKDFRVDPREALKFLLWCRARLEERGWEIRKRDFEEKLDYLTKMANTALRFLEESDYIIKDPYSRVKGTDLYEAYKKWCMEQGIAPMGLQSFYHTVATKYTRYEPGNVVWFKGLRLRVRESLEAYK
jgi:phage/plasmid-associated DNA primase